MSVNIIIGKNFGDEGKGLATDYFAALSQSSEKSCLIIRHNGGAQAGHTVDLPDKRFVFHQLSSGSFRGADTYWAQTFLPDLYKLTEEAEEFFALYKKLPRIIAHPRCRCVYIDDILVNMALETSRDNKRHGSCGMGINEAVVRSAEPHSCIYLGELYSMSQREIYEKLLSLRNSYLPFRLHQLGLSLSEMGEYGELLSDQIVLQNFSEQIYHSLRYVSLKDESVLLEYDDVIFEGAQGLLLDEDCLKFAPHLTSSKTGSINPLSLVLQYKPKTVPQLVYVTRSYVTRHGAGYLPYEQEWQSRGININDPTNITNQWQGSLRFAPHGNLKEFFAPIDDDIRQCSFPINVSCMVTHLNESQGKICCYSGDISVLEWFEHSRIPNYMKQIYLSYSPYSKDITLHNLI